MRYRIVRTVLLVVPWTFMVACASTHPLALEPGALDAAREALLAADAAWLEAAVDGDVEQIMTFWTADAVIDPPGAAPPIIGKAAIRDLVTRRRLHPDYSITWVTTNAWVSANATAGATHRITTVTLPTESGGSVVRRGAFCCMWRRDSGVWQCVLDLGLPLADPAEPAAMATDRNKQLVRQSGSLRIADPANGGHPPPTSPTSRP